MAGYTEQTPRVGNDRDRNLDRVVAVRDRLWAMNNGFCCQERADQIIPIKCPSRLDLTKTVLAGTSPDDRRALPGSAMLKA